MDATKSPLLPPAAYANFLRVAQNRSEFFLAFGQIAQQQVAGAHLVSSVVTSPAHAKSMLRTLAEAVNRYEARFGPIAEPEPTPLGRSAPGAPASGVGGVPAPPVPEATPPRRTKAPASRGRRARSKRS